MHTFSIAERSWSSGTLAIASLTFSLTWDDSSVVTLSASGIAFGGESVRSIIWVEDEVDRLAGSQSSGDERSVQVAGADFSAALDASYILGAFAYLCSVGMARGIAKIV